jgi:TetR/AcrR family transcriptional regulator
MPPNANDEASSVERILSAAEVEFGNHGMDGINIATIARRAGVSTQLIYHYFSKKEELYSEILLRMTANFFRHYSDLVKEKEGPLATIYHFAFHFCGFYRNYPQTGRLVLDQVLHQGHHIRRDLGAEAQLGKLFSSLAAALDGGVSAGVVRPGISAEGLFFLTLVLTLGYTTVTGLLDRIYLEIPELAGDHDVRVIVAEAVIGAIRHPAGLDSPASPSADREAE